MSKRSLWQLNVPVRPAFMGDQLGQWAHMPAIYAVDGPLRDVVHVPSGRLLRRNVDPRHAVEALEWLDKSGHDFSAAEPELWTDEANLFADSVQFELAEIAERARLEKAGTAR